MEKTALLKQAAATLRKQQAELSELRTKVASFDRAEEVLELHLKFEDMSGDMALKKLGEYRSKTQEELNVLEKAIEMSKTGSFLGRVSDDTLPNNLDPLTSFLVSDL